MSGGPVSSLGRMIDPRRREHALAMVVAAVGGAGNGAWQRWHLESGWSHASVVGLRAGLVAFLAWACARELDPDRQWVAQAAVPVAAALALVAPVHAVASVLGLLAVRIVAGTTGQPVTTLDVAWMPVVGAWAATQARGAGVAALALALALGWALRVGHVPTGRARRAVHVVIVALPAATCAAAVLADRFDPRWPTPHGGHLVLEVAALVLAAAATVVPVPPVASRCDHPAHGIATAHVRAARVLAAATIIGALALGGVAQLASLAGLAAALAVAVVAALAARLHPAA